MSKRWKCICGIESPLSEQRCPSCGRPLSMYGSYVTDESEPGIPFRSYRGDDSEEQQEEKMKSLKEPKKSKQKEPQKRETKEKRQGGAGRTILIVLLLLIILILAVLVVILLSREVEPNHESTEPPVLQTTPDTTTPADTQAVQTDPPATNPPATQPPATEPPATEPPIEEGPWLDNVLKADFKISDYKFCEYAGYTYSRYGYPEHVVFVDNLKSLQNASKHRTREWDSSLGMSVTSFITAAWDVSAAQDGSVWAWYMKYSHPSDTTSCDMSCNYVLYIGAEGGVNASLACAEMFAGCTDLKYIDFRGCFHTVGATSMEKMFYNCRSLREVDVTCFNTSDVTNMSNMFYGINASCNIIMDLNRFNTSNVTEYDNFMYYGEQINGVPWPDLFP